MIQPRIRGGLTRVIAVSSFVGRVLHHDAETVCCQVQHADRRVWDAESGW